MKIFGIGLSRTGTTSLGKALGILGYNPIHFFIDEQSRMDILCGKLKNRATETHDAILDTPMCNFFREYDKIYPGSKFIFTDRDVDSWIESCRVFFRKLDDWTEFLPTEEGFPRSHWVCYANIATYGVRFFNEDRFRNVYHAHKRAVLEYFRDRDDLLVLDICGGDRWDNLCSFLEKPVPEVSFPHENKIDKYLTQSKPSPRFM